MTTTGRSRAWTPIVPPRTTLRLVGRFYARIQSAFFIETSPAKVGIPTVVMPPAITCRQAWRVARGASEVRNSSTGSSNAVAHQAERP